MRRHSDSRLLPVIQEGFEKAVGWPLRAVAVAADLEIRIHLRSILRLLQAAINTINSVDRSRNLRIIRLVARRRGLLPMEEVLDLRVPVRLAQAGALVPPRIQVLVIVVGWPPPLRRLEAVPLRRLEAVVVETTETRAANLPAGSLLRARAGLVTNAVSLMILAVVAMVVVVVVAAPTITTATIIVVSEEIINNPEEEAWVILHLASEDDRWTGRNTIH
jgi:hypothetical protein